MHPDQTKSSSVSGMVKARSSLFKMTLAMAVVLSIPLAFAEGVAPIDQVDLDLLVPSGLQAEIIQMGIGNMSTIEQTGNALVARIQQSGLDNIASMEQYGFNNQVNATQAGNLNTIYSQQIGMNLDATLEQFGDFNFLEAAQIGIQPPLFIQQFGGASISIRQDGAAP